MRYTRFQFLGYTRNGANNWQFVDLLSTQDNGGNIVRIGAIYKTEKELLADLTNFAETRGF